MKTKLTVIIACLMVSKALMAQGPDQQRARFDKYVDSKMKTKEYGNPGITNQLGSFKKKSHQSIDFSNPRFVPQQIRPSGLIKSLMGADSSGGGSFAVKDNGKPVLLDYDVYVDDFADTYRHLEDSKITLKPHAEVLGYQKAKADMFLSMPVFSIVRDRLSIWEESSPGMIQLITEALNGIEWRLTPYKLKGFFEDGNIETAVFYSTKLGSWLSVPQWNNAGDMTKAGLLVHEALRNIKLIGKSDISEDNIRMITTKIMLTVPHSHATLDNPKFFKKGSNARNYLEVNGVNVVLAEEDFQYGNGGKVIVTSKNKSLVEDIMPLLDEKVVKGMSEVYIMNLRDYMNNPTHEQCMKLSNSYKYSRHEFSKEAKDVALNIIDIALDYDCDDNTKRALALLATATNDVATLNNLVNNMDRFFGELAIAEYIDEGKNPFKWYETKKRREFKEAIEKLKEFHQELLASGALIQPY